MTINTITKWRVPAIAILLLAMPTIATADPGLVIFGDSLADGGNYRIQTGESSKMPFELVPAAPYARGGFHFSNGETWVEQLAHELQADQSGEPALRAPGKFTNYAYGRARSRPAAASFPDFDLGTQVGLFMSDFDGSAPSGSTYVVATGSNDVRDALISLSGDPTGVTAGGIITAAITATADNIFALWASGARTFLVPNSPNIALTPAVIAAGPEAAFGGFLMSVSYNNGLSGALDALAGLPGIEIIRMDLFSILHGLVADPGSQGLTNVTDSCITPGVLGDAVCDSPAGYLFWDGVHPTRAVHGYLASEALGLLNQ